MIATDIPTYHELLRALLDRLPDVHDVKTTFALREIKHTTELPIGQRHAAPWRRHYRL